MKLIKRYTKGLLNSTLIRKFKSKIFLQKMESQLFLVEQIHREVNLQQPVTIAIQTQILMAQSMTKTQMNSFLCFLVEVLELRLTQDCYMPKVLTTVQANRCQWAMKATKGKDKVLIHLPLTRVMSLKVHFRVGSRPSYSIKVKLHVYFLRAQSRSRK